MPHLGGNSTSSARQFFGAHTESTLSVMCIHYIGPPNVPGTGQFYFASFLFDLRPAHGSAWCSTPNAQEPRQRSFVNRLIVALFFRYPSIRRMRHIHTQDLSCRLVCFHQDLGNEAPRPSYHRLQWEGSGWVAPLRVDAGIPEKPRPRGSCGASCERFGRSPRHWQCVDLVFLSCLDAGDT